MSDVSAVVFSRDRPAQLDLLLRSMELACQSRDGSLSTFYRNVWVLFLATDAIYMDGYRRLFALHPWVRRVNQEGSSFDIALRPLLHDADFTTFFVDDDVFYRRAVYPALTPFSFRPGDYHYPFSVDGCTYASDWVLRKLEGRSPQDPTQLEAGVSSLAEREGTRFFGCSPCLVGVPANRVSPSSGMPHMGRDPRMMTVRFLRGERIDLHETVAEILRLGDAIAPHVELEYVWGA